MTPEYGFDSIIEVRFDIMDSEFHKVNNELDKLNPQLSSLRSGQIDIHKEVKTAGIILQTSPTKMCGSQTKMLRSYD